MLFTVVMCERVLVIKDPFLFYFIVYNWSKLIETDINKPRLISVDNIYAPSTLNQHGSCYRISEILF